MAENQRKDDDITIIKSRKDDGITITKSIVAVSLPLITIIGLLIVYIYETNARGTSSTVSSINSKMDDLIKGQVSNNSIMSAYMINNDKKLDRLQRNIKHNGDKATENGNRLIIVCNNQKQYWNVHGCKE